MLEKYKVITATHKTAPFKAIGAYVLAGEPEEVSAKLKEYKKLFDLDELYYLATCNRIIFIIASEQDLGEQFKNAFLEHLYFSLDIDVSNHFQLLRGDNAVTHLYKVAGSMDSLVVGEREILRQMRAAYDWCLAEDLTKDNIRLLFQSIVETAKHIYSNTRIGEKPVSIVSLAVKELNKTAINEHSKVLMVGAGKTNTLVSKFLVKQGFRNVEVFNRSIEGAEKIAQKFNGEAHRITHLDAYEGAFDVIIVCTGSVEPIITPSIYRELLKGDTSQKVIVDLSVPYNVSPSVVDNNDINYISVDSLKVLSEENLKFRHREVELAETMLISALNEFKKRTRERTFETAFQKIPSEIKAIKQHAMETVFATELDKLDPQSKEIVEKMLSYMEKKCIGIPMKVVRELAD